MKALIVYYTKTGHTLDAARFIAEGIRQEGWKTKLLEARYMEGERLENCRAFVVGSPCRAGSVPGAAGIAGPVKKMLNRLPEGCLEGQYGAAFSIHCSYGGQKTARNIDEHLEQLGATVPLAGMAVKAGAFLSLYRGPEITDEDAKKLREFGRDLAAARDSEPEGRTSAW
jgi:flavodoxin